MRDLFLERLRPTPLITRRSELSPGASLALRIVILFALLIFIVAFHWLERDSLKDNYDGVVSFSDVIYFTMISATTTGYGDVVPVTTNARLFDALVVTPIRIFFILILAGTAYTFLIKRTWSNWLMRRIQQKLTGHIIVTGFGTSGSHVVKELVARGADPKRIVVIDLDEAALARAERCGCNVMQADATRDETLRAARIAEARAMMISAGRDDTSILICLSARHLAPELPISVAVRAQDNEFPAKAAGATTVINPASFGALLLAGSIDGTGIAEYMADLASASGHVRLHEREIEAFEVGQSLSSAAIGVGLRVVRDGKEIGFWEKAADRLELGDRIIEVLPEHLVPRVPVA